MVVLVGVVVDEVGGGVYTESVMECVVCAETHLV